MSATTAAALNVVGSSLRFKNLLVVIKQTAFEEYSQARWTCDVATEQQKPIR